jgi:hypothetical protein
LLFALLFLSLARVGENSFVKIGEYGFRFLNAERFGTIRAVQPFNRFPRR